MSQLLVVCEEKMERDQRKDNQAKELQQRVD